MYKISTLFLLLLICFSCNKNSQKSACGAQACTDLFGSVGVMFKDKDNNPVSVTKYSVVDLRTNDTLKKVLSPTANLIAGYEIVVDDSNLKDLSTGGDNLKVSGTNPATNQVATGIIKVSGGACNCHVGWVSGPQTITFN